MEVSEWISLGIAALAFIVSIISLVINHMQNKKLSSLSMQARYYEKIFDEYLIDTIPISREYIKYIDNKLIDAERLNDTLDTMKKKSLYFKYNNDKFYKELIKTIENLQKKLADYSNVTETDQDKQYENIATIKEDITEIYHIIYKYSNGSK